ncbi:hypothetical protein MK280_15205 [Myxococcota bacterium]|nr:hypothetical protein [Myxococcota bacterium]
MRIFLLLILAALLGANPVHALELCAKIDKNTGEPKDGTTIKLRATCKVKKNGAPIEVSIGTTEQLAAITELPCASQVGTNVIFEGCTVHMRSGEGRRGGRAASRRRPSMGSAI